jgi:hypothetical protein
MVRQLWKYPSQGITQLRTYAHATFHKEINKTLIRNINDLPEEEALWYLRKIKEPRWIEAKGQREMDVQIFLETLDTEESFDTTALIDSGCMTTSISDRFV